MYNVRLGYSLDTNVNARFYQVSMHARINACCPCPSTRSRPYTLALKWELGHLLNVQRFCLVWGNLLLSTRCKARVSKWLLTGRKGVNNVHSSRIGYTQGLNKTPFFVTTQALVLRHQVGTFPKFPSEEIDWHRQTVGQCICSCPVLGLPGEYNFI